MKPFRIDLALAAYAISLGYELRAPQGVALARIGPVPTVFDKNGFAIHGLHFVIGDMHVWETARGWRVARLTDGTYEQPTSSDFYRKLKDALDEGARNWRDR